MSDLSTLVSDQYYYGPIASVMDEIAPHRRLVWSQAEPGWIARFYDTVVPALIREAGWGITRDAALRQAIGQYYTQTPVTGVAQSDVVAPVTGPALEVQVAGLIERDGVDAVRKRLLAMLPDDAAVVERAQEHVFLVAVQTTTGLTREEAELNVHEWLGGVDEQDIDERTVESWWIAEDDRHDRSDCDSAVFVTPGKQQEARALLLKNNLTS